MMGARRSTACSLFLFIVGVVMAVATSDLSRVARLVPMFVLVPTLALLALQLCLDLAPVATRSVRRAVRGLVPGGMATPSAVGSLAEASSARAILLPLAFLSGILLVGLEWGPPLVTLGYLRVAEQESWGRSAGIALALVAVLWLIFDVALGVALHGGVLGEVLFCRLGGPG